MSDCEARGSAVASLDNDVGAGSRSVLDSVGGRHFQAGHITSVIALLENLLSRLGVLSVQVNENADKPDTEMNTPN